MKIREEAKILAIILAIVLVSIVVNVALDRRDKNLPKLSHAEMDAQYDKWIDNYNP